LRSLYLHRHDRSSVRLTAQQLCNVCRNSAPIVLVPDIRTRIEAALTTPNALSSPTTNIDFRFGPKVRIDALVRVGADRSDSGSRAGARHLARPRSRAQQLRRHRRARLLESLTLMTISEELDRRDDRRATTLTFTSAGGLESRSANSGRVQRGLLFTGSSIPSSRATRLTAPSRQSIKDGVVKSK
jgi:hypothetical protein